METLQIRNSNLELPELVEKLREFDALKSDIVLNSQGVIMQNGTLKFYDHKNERGAHLPTNVEPNAHMHRQIAEKLSIPWRYYEKMQGEFSELLDINVARWFMKNKKNYLLRTYQTPGGELFGRALLSDSFKIIDHLDILMTTLEAIKEEGLTDIEVDKADITETNMYVRFINKAAKVDGRKFLENYRNPENLQQKPGVIAGFVMKNSETGQGAFQIAPRLKVLACNNGMIIDKDAYRRTHLGAKLEQGRINWSEQTKTSNQQLIKSQVKDFVKHFSSEDYLKKAVDTITKLGDQELNDPVETVKNATKYCEVPESKQNEILNFFTKSGDTKASGVAQAITYYAHSQEDADVRYDLEAKSMDVLHNIKKFDINPN